MIVRDPDNQKGVETKSEMRIKRGRCSSQTPDLRSCTLIQDHLDCQIVFGIGCHEKKSDRKEDSREKAKKSVYDPDSYAEHPGRLCKREQSKRSKAEDSNTNKHAFRANPNTVPDLNCSTDGEFHRINTGLVTNLGQ